MAQVFAAKAIRLLAVAPLLPLVEACSGYKAPAFSECLSEQGQLMNGLSTRIDVRDLRLLLHPKWNETPPSHRELAITRSNSTSQSLTKQADATPNKLASLNGGAFDRAYIDNGVTYHKTVNTALSDTLIPYVSRPQLLHSERAQQTSQPQQTAAETGVHPLVIKIAVGAAVWFVVTSWLAFAWDSEIDYLLVIVTLFFAIFFTLFLLTASFSVHDARCQAIGATPPRKQRSTCQVVQAESEGRSRETA